MELITRPNFPIFAIAGAINGIAGVLLCSLEGVGIVVVTTITIMTAFYLEERKK